MTRLARAALMPTSIFLLPLVSAAAPPADATANNAAKTKAAVPPKPPHLKLRHQSATLGYRVSVKPGIPDPGTTVIIEVDLVELLEDPHPRFGTRRPIDDATLHAVLVGPAKGKGKRGAGDWAQAHRAIKLEDAGAYGLSFTPPLAGLYGLYLRGQAGAAGPIDCVMKLSFGAWPMPEGEAPALPSRLPTMSAGDLTHGRTLCQKHCRTDVAGARPQARAPEFLPSGLAAALGDDALLTEVLTKKRRRTLDPIEKSDLLLYLRGLHWSVRDFFAEATAFMAHAFTINDHGRERLKETAGLNLRDDEATATVFVVYKGGTADGTPILVDFTDRVARDSLKKEQRLGYLLFVTVPGETKAFELGIALNREPSYVISQLRARDGAGKQDRSFNKQLSFFHGQGKFNDAKSLRKGPRSLRSKLLPVYLRAAELATMYYADEREFTAFDGAF